jgi:hypothetical protein
MYTKFWLENLKGREFIRPRHRWEDIGIGLRVGRCRLDESGSG